MTTTANIPFMFVHSDGRFLRVHEFPVLMENDLNALIKVCEEKSRDELVGLLSALKTCREQGVFTPTNFGSLHRRSCLVIAAPKYMSPIFDPDPNDLFSPNPSSWGWVAKVLLDHKNPLRRLTKELKITIDWANLGLINKTQKMIDEGVLTIRQSNPLLDLCAGQSFVAFDPSWKRYLDKSGRFEANLAGAAFFESAREAEKFIKKSTDRKNIMIMQIDLSLNTVVSNPQNESFDVMQEVIALRQKEELEQALKDASIEQLQARLAALGEEAQPKSPRKKM